MVFVSDCRLSCPRRFLTLFTLVYAMGWSQGQTTDKYSIPLQTVTDCRTGAGETFHEYYDTSQMSCRPCTQNNTIQTVSPDGLQCICTEDYRITNFLGNVGIVTCAKCPDSQVASLDGWGCVTCSTTTPPGDECPACDLPSDVEADRDLSGRWLLDASNDTTVTCVTCLSDTLPDAEGDRCVRCNQQLSVQTGCACPDERLSGGLCFASENDLVLEDVLDFSVTYGEVDETYVELVSGYLQQHLRTAHGSCTNYSSIDPATRVDYSNLTSCQHLANMCVMILYTDANAISGPRDPCALYLNLVRGGDSNYPQHVAGYRTQTNLLQAWRANMAWLYYDNNDDTPEEVLEDDSIDQEYTKDSLLEFKAATYNLSGEFLGLHNLEDDDFLFCGSGDRIAKGAFKFGTEYNKECTLSVDRLFEKTNEPLVFHDIYLQYTSSSGETRLHAVPILLMNYTDSNGDYPNTEDDWDNWQLVRRYFVFDRVTGVKDGETSPTVIRFLKDFRMIIPQQQNAKSGLILTPYVEMTYDFVTEEEIGQGEYVNVYFSIQYIEYLSETSRNVYIAIGVLWAIALGLSILQTANWNKREGKISIDCLSILRFSMFFAGNTANAFFLVMFGFSLWAFIVYKAQNVMYLVPDDTTEFHLKAFIGSAFALKFLHLVQLLITQCRTDIFFIDWEKPKRSINEEQRELPPRNETEAYAKASRKSASVWRSYLVANEWVELSTIRKVKPFWQLVFMLIILHVAGVKNLARIETDSNVSYLAEEHRPEFSLVFRFALASGVYVGLAIVQWLFRTVFWDRCVDDPIMNFVDLCSLANVSVFTLPYEQYGYYIHGRSVHGLGDVGLEEMHLNMKREERGFCSHRGLVPGMDEQLFEIFIPNKFRAEYNRILFSVYQERMAVGRQAPTSGDGKLNPETEKRIEAYLVINKFMQDYIDHNLKKIDYIVTKKNLWGRMMDTEAIDNFESGYFFLDSGHKFDRLLFYGQESVLVLFELLLFAVMDFASGSYVIAAIVTYVMNLIIHTVRHGAGKKNIARKTMTDGRFLL